MEPGPFPDRLEREEMLQRLAGETDLEQFLLLTRGLDPADVADVLGRIDRERRARLFASLEDSAAAEVLEEVDPDLRGELLSGIPLARTSQIVEEMPADEAADLLGDLPPGKAGAILDAMDAGDAADVRELLDYEGNTAGGQMTTEFIAVAEDLTAQETIERLRELAPEAETVYYLYVVDADERLTGVVSLRTLITSDPGSRVADIMSRDVISVPANADQEEAADLIARYNLIAVPVVDEERRPIGIITVDDAVDVIDEEAAEDVYQLSGAPEGPRASLLLSLRTRLPRMVGSPVASGILAAVVGGAGVWCLLQLLTSEQSSAAPPVAESQGGAAACFLPVLMALSWLQQSQARAAILSRGGAGGDRPATLWQGLTLELAASTGLSVLCGGIIALLLRSVLPGNPAWIWIGPSLAAGLLVSGVSGHLLPRLAIRGGPVLGRTPTSPSAWAHVLGVVAYFAAAYWISR